MCYVSEFATGFKLLKADSERSNKQDSSPTHINNKMSILHTPTIKKQTHFSNNNTN